MGLGGWRVVLLGALLSALLPGSALALRWSAPVTITQDGAQSVSCASTSLCVVAGGSGLLVSTAPLAGAGSWHPVWSPAPPSCPPPTGPTPGGNFCTPPPRPPIAMFAPAAVSCPSVTLCVAVGIDGRSRSNEAFVSTDPAGGSSAWTQVTLGGSGGMQSISCNSASVCVATTRKGFALTTSNPGGGSKAWTSIDLYPYQPAYSTNG